MGIPVFFLMILVLAGLLIISVVVYLQIYKRNINKALVDKEAKATHMTSPHRFAIILLVLFLIISVGISYFVGYKTAYDDFENGMETSRLVHDVFYAEIISIDGQLITVDGLDINDCSYRDQYTLEIYPETQLVWHKTEVNISDLKPGHLVSIVLYSVEGEINTDVNPITDVARIQILSDDDSLIE